MAVKIQAGSLTYCVDSTEVTNGQYAEFLAAITASPGIVTLGHGCPVEMTNFTPTDPMAVNPVWPTDATNYPVVHVDWCDAYAYCAWAGKRLCGQIGGGSLQSEPSPVPPSTETVSQWLNACTAGGMNDYPYGGTFERSFCEGASAGGAITPVESNRQCVGGYPGIYDMSGNVWEWLDACRSDAFNDFCSSFGGGFDSPDTSLSCLSQRWWTRTAGAADLGFRCCEDL